MRVILQRVTRASVRVEDKIVGEVGQGALLLVGLTHDDGREHAEWMAKKIATLRIFPALDGPSGFDRSLQDVNGAVLAVSQFTLYGDTRNGRRPGFSTAARPEHAAPLFDYFVERLRAEGIAHVATGIFGADMQVELVNYGPVTLILESQG
jgi:D-tyrosyl-tRNA(Tyr) deacylase